MGRSYFARFGMTEASKGRICSIFLLAVFVLFSLSSSLQKSATWDETHYLGLGDYLFREHRWDIPSVLYHPPLTYYLSSLPLLFFDLDRTCFREGLPWDIAAAIRRGQCLLRNSHPSGDELLFWARLPTVCLAVLLGFYVYSWTFAMFGLHGALLSLFLYCFSPNLLAHARLATPDLYLSSFGFIAFYYLWRSFESTAVRYRLYCGIFLGFALLSKYSGLLWIPMFLCLAFLQALFGKRKLSTAQRIQYPALSMGTILLTALVVLLLGYGFHISLYLKGIRIQKDIVGNGLPAFLNGEVSQHGGWWYYYILAFVMKVPLPMLILLAASCTQWAWNRFPKWFNFLCILFPITVVFVAFSCLYEVNIGLRYILPVFPFFMVLCGALPSLWRHKRFSGIFFMVPLLIWYGYESLSIHPDYLAYFNQLAGGPRNGYKHLVDSNLDWGQDLKGLKKYMDRHGIEKVKLSYFGTADPKQYGITYEALPSFDLPESPPKRVLIDKGDILAISVTNLYPLYVDLGVLREFLHRSAPVDHIGYSIFIYKIEGS